MNEIGLLPENMRTGGCRERKGHIADLISYPESGYIATVERWLGNGGDVMLRNIAMETYRAPDCRAHASLISLLREGDADVRGLAPSLLGDIRDGDAVNRKATGNRGILAKVISMAGSAGSLLLFAADGDPEVRAEVGLALGPPGTPESKDALGMLRNDPAEEVRAAAKKSMKKFCKESARI